MAALCFGEEKPVTLRDYYGSVLLPVYEEHDLLTLFKSQSRSHGVRQMHQSLLGNGCYHRYQLSVQGRPRVYCHLSG